MIKQRRIEKWKNQRKRGQIIGSLLLCLLCLTVYLVPEAGQKVQAEVTQANIIMSGSMSPVSVQPGAVVSLKIPVKAVGTGYMNEPAISVDTTSLPFEVVSEFALQSKSGAEVKSISSSLVYLCFDIRINEDAKKGNYKFAIEFTGADTENVSYTSTITNPVIIHVDSQKKAPQVGITVQSFPESVSVGDVFQVSFKLENQGELPAIKVKAVFDELTAAGIAPVDTSDTKSIGTMAAGYSEMVTATFKVGQDAAGGTKKLAIKARWQDDSGTSYEESQGIYLKIIKGEEKKASLKISQVKYKEEVKPGDQFNLRFKLENAGLENAYKASLALDDLVAAGITPDSSNDRADFGTFPSSRSDNISIPLTVADIAEPGVKKITLKLSYYETKDSATPLEVSTSIYITVLNTKAVTQSNLVLYNMTQTPNVPMPGDIVTVSFDIQNKGLTDAIRIKLMPTDFSNKTVSPYGNEPYKYIKKIKAGSVKHISMHFKVEDVADKGLVTVNMEISYRDTASNEYTDKAALYVMNVQKEVSSGVPKLIISDYDLGTEALKAGETFTFKFDVHNTHKNLSADNIKVTLTSENNIYSVVNGSNSFYIDSIAAGETVHEKIKLKVKSDCVSKAYPLTIAFEYEYEGMQKLENEISTGLKINEILNFQVMEIARPKVENIIVGTYDQPVMGEAATMQFDFYNLGKSTLYNVTAKIESEDLQAAKPTVFIGNTEAGKGGTYELEVIPLIGNDIAAGNLIVTYEDSNGTSFDITQEFSQEIGEQQEVSMDDMMDMGDMSEAETKEPVLAVWQFILAECVLFIAAIAAGRKVVSGLWLKYLRKKEKMEAENENED